MIPPVIKKPIFLIPLTMAAAIILVSILAWRALVPINQKNGFGRNFITTKLTMLRVSKPTEIVAGIAGITEHQIYFKTKDPSKLWQTDQNLQNGKLIALNIPNNSRIASAFYSTVDSPFVHVMACNGPAVIKADLSGKATSMYRFPTALFTRAVVIGGDSYIFRGFDTTLRGAGQVFIKGNPKTGELLRNNLVKNANDGTGITSDGYLNFDRSSNMLVYVSYYQNRFYCLDTNLNLLNSWNTIDPGNTLEVKVVNVNGTLTNTTPTRIINGRGQAFNGKLYNVSRRQADNEPAGLFSKNDVLDVYELTSGSYLGSFYIPYYEMEKVSDFKVTENSIIVQYKSYIALYKRPI